MAKKAYIGVDCVARKVKKMYVGVDGAARKIKKGYVGVGGVARPFFGGGEPVCYGPIEPLKYACRYISAASIGNYALFAGGLNTGSGARYNAVTAYDGSLVRSYPTALGTAGYNWANAVVGNHVLFVAGDCKSSAPTDYVYAYNESLTMQQLTGLSVARHGPGSGTTTKHALFAGGYHNSVTSTSGRYNTVDGYDESLTRIAVSGLSIDRSHITGASIDGLVIFAGGNEGYSGTGNSVLYSTRCEVYNESLTRSDMQGLSVGRRLMSSSNAGRCALFIGGSDSGGNLSVVEAFDSTLSRLTATPMSVARSSVAAASLQDYAFVGTGGSNVVECYDDSLSKTTLDPLPTSRSTPAASVSNYVIFGGAPASATSVAYSVV